MGPLNEGGRWRIRALKSMQSPKRGRGGSCERAPNATNGELAPDAAMLTNGVSELRVISRHLSTIAMPVYTASSRWHSGLLLPCEQRRFSAGSVANKSEEEKA